jgi:hypothetical protein
MPGVDPITGPVSLAEAAAEVGRQLALARHSDGEPALRCYVLASCHAVSAGTPVRARMVVAVSPRTLRRGNPTTISISARSSSKPVDATASAFGKTVRLGSDGKGHLRVTPGRKGRRTLALTADGYRSVSVTLTVR